MEKSESKLQFILLFSPYIVGLLLFAIIKLIWNDVHLLLLLIFVVVGLFINLSALGEKTPSSRSA